MTDFNKISNQMLAGSSTAMKAELMKVAKNFFKSGKTFDFIETRRSIKRLRKVKNLNNNDLQ